MAQATRTAPYKNWEKYSPYSIHIRRKSFGANLDSSGNVRIYRAVGDNQKALVIEQADTTNNPVGLEVINAGTGASLSIDCDATDGTNKAIGLHVDVDNAGAGDQIAIDVDLVDESKSYFARFNATSNWTSSKDPETHAEAGWVKIMVGTTAYFIPYYAAS